MPSYTRRGVLTTLALATGGAAQSPSNYIDAHVHVWTPDTRAYPRPAQASGPNYKPDSFTPEQLLAIAKPVGVSRIALVQMSFYGFDNSYMLDAIKRYPGTFAGIGIVDHQAPGVRKEMIRLQALHVHGYRIAPGSDTAGWLDAPGMHEMWKVGAERSIAMCPLMGPTAFASVDRMCAKFPETPVVIDHMGRIGADGVIRDEDVRALCALARYKHTHVKVSAFYAFGKKKYPYTDLAPLIRALYDAYGPQRLMWASDSPFQVQPPYTYTGSIELVRDRLDFLTKSDKEWLLRKSAEKVFFPDTH